MNRLRWQHINPSHSPKFQRQQRIHRNPLPQILLESHRAISISKTLLTRSQSISINLNQSQLMRCHPERSEGSQPLIQLTNSTRPISAETHHRLRHESSRTLDSN